MEDEVVSYDVHRGMPENWRIIQALIKRAEATDPREKGRIAAQFNRRPSDRPLIADRLGIEPSDDNPAYRQFCAGMKERRHQPALSA